ncbi:MAG: 30S ribosomal protein S2 [Gammaproteobacteria bacterium]|nr:30S ribosomal protein S2 [Gammaproteobacteria bacterium]
MSTVSMRDLLEAGVHFGHQTRYWNPKMAQYIFGARLNVHIIDLEKTLPMFKEALNFASSVASKKGKILFVGTKDVASGIIREHALRSGMPFVDHRWLGGMLTNYKTIRQSIRRLRDLEKLMESPRFQGFTKKERLTLTREKSKLDQSLGGIKDMGGLPDALFIVDVGNESIAIEEARKLSIPVIGIVDTNNSPDFIDYVIPGNDDSIRSIQVYCKQLADVIITARERIAASEPKQAEKPKPEVKKKEEVGTRKVVTKKREEAPAEKPVVASEADKSGTADKEKATSAKKPAAKKTVIKDAASKTPATKITDVKTKVKSVDEKPSSTETVDTPTGE